jgi:transcriptional regulator with XRE-family HTH domain
MLLQHDRDAIEAARKALGRQLAALRQAAGYNQQGFAPLTGYGRSTLANVETGRQNVARSFWIRCAQELAADTALPITSRPSRRPAAAVNGLPKGSPCSARAWFRSTDTRTRRPDWRQLGRWQQVSEAREVQDRLLALMAAC